MNVIAPCHAPAIALQVEDVQTVKTNATMSSCEVLRLEHLKQRWKPFYFVKGNKPRRKIGRTLWKHWNLCPIENGECIAAVSVSAREDGRSASTWRITQARTGRTDVCTTDATSCGTYASVLKTCWCSDRGPSHLCLMVWHLYSVDVCICGWQQGKTSCGDKFYLRQNCRKKLLAASFGLKWSWFSDIRTIKCRVDLPSFSCK